MSAENHRGTSRILDILEVLASSENGYTLTELANTIHAPKSSIFPIVHTLLNRKYITIDKNTSKYSIGVSTYALGSTYLNKKNLLSDIIDKMKSIVDASSETCQLGILQNNEVLYIAKVDSPEPIRMISHVGKKLSAHCTALGKALICDLSREELNALYPDALVKYTEETITDLDTLYKQLEEARSTQIAFEFEEVVDYIQCFAVPLRKNGKIIAALSVSIPVFRATNEKIEQVKKLLLDAQTSIESMMENINNDLSSLI